MTGDRDLQVRSCAGQSLGCWSHWLALSLSNSLWRLTTVMRDRVSSGTLFALTAKSVTVLTAPRVELTSVMNAKRASTLTRKLVCVKIAMHMMGLSSVLSAHHLRSALGVLQHTNWALREQRQASASHVRANDVPSVMISPMCVWHVRMDSIWMQWTTHANPAQVHVSSVHLLTHVICVKVMASGHAVMAVVGVSVCTTGSHIQQLHTSASAIDSLSSRMATVWTALS